MFKVLVVSMLLGLSFQAHADVLDDYVNDRSISIAGANLIREVMFDVNEVERYGDVCMASEIIESAIITQAQERRIYLEGENKDGLVVRNIIRVIISAIRPTTGGCPTHDGRGHRNSP